MRHYVTVALPSGWLACYSHIHGPWPSWPYWRAFRWEPAPPVEGA